MLYTNSLDPDETPSNLASHPDTSCYVFDTQTTFSPTLRDIEALRILKQKRNWADKNLFGGLWVNHWLMINTDWQHRHNTTIIFPDPLVPRAEMIDRYLRIYVFISRPERTELAWNLPQPSSSFTDKTAERWSALLNQWKPNYQNMRRNLGKPGLWRDKKNRLWSDPARSLQRLIRACSFCHIWASAKSTFLNFCTIKSKLWI